MDIAKQKLAEEIRNTVAYCEMSEEQEKLVVEYEVEIYKPLVDELKTKMNKHELINHIHNLWMDYDMADETEDILIKYVEQ